MKKKLLWDIFFLILILSSSTISANLGLGENLSLSCGGDKYLVIGCVGGQDLIFVGLIPSGIPIPGGGGGTPEKPLEKFFSYFSINLGNIHLNGKIVFLSGLVIIILIILFIIEEEERKRRNKKQKQIDF